MNMRKESMLTLFCKEEERGEHNNTQKENENQKDESIHTLLKRIPNDLMIQKTKTNQHMREDSGSI